MAFDTPPAEIASTGAAAFQDAALIRISGEHIDNLHAYSASLSDLEPEDDPLWHAYQRTCDAIRDAKPKTLAGLASKAWAALAEARTSFPAQGEFWDTSTAGPWARSLVRDIIRLNGETPPPVMKPRKETGRPAFRVDVASRLRRIADFMDDRRGDETADVRGHLALDAAAKTPDADIINMCQRHIANLHACNTRPASDPRPLGEAGEETGPAWEGTLHQLQSAHPRTLAGVVAMSRVCVAEATTPSGGLSPKGTPGEDLAFQTIRHLLSLFGNAVQLDTHQIA